MQLSSPEITSSWFAEFSEFLASSDAAGATTCFHGHGYLRDILVLTWRNRTLEGHQKIAAYLKDTIDAAHITAMKLDDHKPCTTAVGSGQGYFFPNESPSGEWKALSVFMMLGDIRGHEESGPELGIYDGHTISWRLRWPLFLNITFADHRLVVGGGQTGLNVAARFKQMHIPAFIIKREARIGDVWRKRYPTLTLHSPRTQHTTLPTPKYDTDSKRWTVVINRNGEHITMNPKHIVIAAGTLGKPLFPVMSEIERFKGTILHSALYQGGAPFSNKRIVVVGAGNSAADVCQDLVFHGASSVTMVQRSATRVMDAKNSGAAQERLWPEAAVWAAEKETHAGLREAGLKLNMGPDGAGPYFLMFEKFGGLDVGCAQLIRDGKVKVKQGVEPTSYTEDSVVFSDGSVLSADVVVYATSYRSIRDDLRPLFTDAVIDQTSPLWGIDEEGELNGCYRSSGYNGLWFAAGNFAISRFFSKQLALEIKAIELV
ncbi:FAD/NAD-P-binding domain-containing protein [Mycena galopus ATCC 62051]|nr:FAD/NAD-P-binding domain-containing protein [Mycena galopus ATCC 62051]